MGIIPKLNIYSPKIHLLSFSLYTSAPQPIKGSDYVSQRTLCRRNKFLMQQLQNTSGHSEETSAIQTSIEVTSIEDEKKHNVLEKVGIYILQ